MPAPAGGVRRLPQARCGWCCEEAHQAMERGDRRQQRWWALLLPCTLTGSDTPALPVPLQNPGLVEQYLSAILSLEPNQNYAGMLGLLVQFCTSHKEMDVVNRHKAGGLTGGGEGNPVLPWWPQSLILSEVCWFSRLRPWPFTVMYESEGFESFASSSGLGWILP